MAADQFEVKCAKCKVELQGPSDPKPEDRFSCPKCGIGDSLENIGREIRDHAPDQGADRITTAMREALRGSKNLKFIEKPRVKRSHRFMIDL